MLMPGFRYLCRLFSDAVTLFFIAAADVYLPLAARYARAVYRYFVSFAVFVSSSPLLRRCRLLVLRFRYADFRHVYVALFRAM